MAGIPYDHYVLDNGSDDGTHAYLRGLEEEGLIQWLHISPDNKGQCIATNLCLNAIGAQYDFICRFDNDITPVTDGFLAKLVEAQRELGGMAVVSPDITGLLNKPKPFGRSSDKKFKYAFVEILGGACRLTPGNFFNDFRLSEHGPLALGEARQVAIYAHDNKIPMAYVEDILIEHPTEKHVADNPDYFKRRRFEEFLPHGL